MNRKHPHRFFCILHREMVWVLLFMLYSVKFTYIFCIKLDMLYISEKYRRKDYGTFSGKSLEKCAEIL